jgi:hypothetical protein
MRPKIFLFMFVLIFASCSPGITLSPAITPVPATATYTQEIIIPTLSPTPAQQAEVAGVADLVAVQAPEIVWDLKDPEKFPSADFEYLTSAELGSPRQVSQSSGYSCTVSGN